MKSNVECVGPFFRIILESLHSCFITVSSCFLVPKYLSSHWVKPDRAQERGAKQRWEAAVQGVHLA